MKIAALCGALLLALGQGEPGTFVLSYAVDEQVSLGEPVLLSYQFRNSGTEVVGVQLVDGERNGFFRLDVIGPTGRKETLPLFKPELEIPFIGVVPRRSFRDSLLVSNWLKFDQVGTYRVVVSYEGAVRIGQDARQSTSDVKFERKATFDVRVTPRDPSGLLRRAQALLVQLNSNDNRTGPGPLRSMQALTSIHDPVVIPVLVELIHQHKFFQDVAFSAVVRIGGAEAQRALTSLASGADKETAIKAQRAMAALVKKEGRIEDLRPGS